MKGAQLSLRDRIRAQLADLKMPGALESLDDILSRIDGGELAGAEAIEALLGSHITLRNNRRLQAAKLRGSGYSRRWARHWCPWRGSGCCMRWTPC